MAGVLGGVTTKKHVHVRCDGCARGFGWGNGQRQLQRRAAAR